MGLRTLRPSYYLDHFTSACGWWSALPTRLEDGHRTLSRAFGPWPRSAGPLLVRMINRKGRSSGPWSLDYAEMSEPGAGAARPDGAATWARVVRIDDLPAPIGRLTKPELPSLADHGIDAGFRSRINKSPCSIKKIKKSSDRGVTRGALFRVVERIGWVAVRASRSASPPPPRVAVPVRGRRLPCLFPLRPRGGNLTAFGRPSGLIKNPPSSRRRPRRVSPGGAARPPRRSFNCRYRDDPLGSPAGLAGPSRGVRRDGPACRTTATPRRPGARGRGASSLEKIRRSTRRGRFHRLSDSHPASGAPLPPRTTRPGEREACRSRLERPDR